MHTISVYGLQGQQTTMPIIPSQSPASSSTVVSDPSEESPLLPKPQLQPADLHDHPQTWLTVVKDRYFWWLFLLTVAIIGSAEMVIGNIGTVVTSLISASQGTSQAVSNQVQLISICNTVARLLSGPLIDLLCPNPLYPTRRHTTSRFVFVACAGTLLVVCYSFTGFLANSNAHTWVLSGGVGVAYGMMWTVLPTLVKSIWGDEHFGRTFGMMAYAAFFGTSLFTGLFAYNVEHHKTEPGNGNERCIGSKCWRTTFQVCSVILLVAVLSVSGLWRRWRAVV